MAEVAISDLTAVTSWATGDLFEVTDVSDTTDDAAGTSKKITAQNLFRLPDGSAAAPTLAWQNSTGTGFYRVGSNDMAGVADGTRKIRWNTDGLAAGTIAPVSGYAFSVGGDQIITRSTTLGTNPATLVIRATDNGTWSVDDVFARVDFDSQDASGSGAGTKARIAAVMENTTGGEVGLSFLVDNGAALTERMRLDHDGRLTVQSHLQQSESATIADDATHVFSTVPIAPVGSTATYPLYVLSCRTNNPNRQGIFFTSLTAQHDIGSGSDFDFGGNSNNDTDNRINVWSDGTDINVKNREGLSLTFTLIRIGGA